MYSTNKTALVAHGRLRGFNRCKGVDDVLNLHRRCPFVNSSIDFVLFTA